MKRRKLGGLAFAALLALAVPVTQAWGKPRHRQDLPGATHPALGRIDVQSRDTALPSGFEDVSQDVSGEEHSQGMVAAGATVGAPMATFFYDGRSAFDAQAAYSPDGANWFLSTMPSAPSEITTNTGLSDPTMTIDSSGRFYAGGGGPDPVNTGQQLSVYAMRSDNGGVSFNTPTVAIEETAQQTADFLDHQSNAADASGTTSNDYVSVSAIATIPKSGGSESQVILFNSSSNGAATWNYPPAAALQISDNAPSADDSNATPVTRVDGSGKVYVSWVDVTPSNQALILLDKAAIPSAGNFGTDVRIATLNSSGDSFTVYLGLIRCGIFVNMATDNGSNTTKGDVYVAWSDQVAGQGGAFKVEIARSTDGGNTFSAPIRVDTTLDSAGSNSDDQFLPTLAVNPDTGQVVVNYYSTRFNTSDRGGPNPTQSTDWGSGTTPLVDFLVATGTPNSSGGLDFSGPYRVTPTSIDVNAANNNIQYDPVLGDYTGLTFQTASNGTNSVMEFVTVDESNRVVENAAVPFDGSATLTSVSGGTFEFKAAASGPVGGLGAFVDWGDGTNSTGIDVTHNYAAGAQTATAVVYDGSTAFRNVTLTANSNGVFSSSGSSPATSTVITANSLVSLSTSGVSTSGGSGSTSSSTGGTSTGGTGSTTTTTGTGGDTSVSGGSSSSTTNNPSSGGGGGGCFIATAAYGSYFEPHVMTLRHFRDEDLLTNGPGQMFVEFYYRYSPPIADWIRQREWARALVRLFLTPMVFGLEHTMLALLAFLSGGAAGIVWWRTRRSRNIGAAA